MSSCGWVFNIPWPATRQNTGPGSIYVWVECVPCLQEKVRYVTNPNAWHAWAQAGCPDNFFLWRDSKRIAVVSPGTCQLHPLAGARS